MVEQLRMVHAQISCKSMEFHDHNQANDNVYQKRQTLSAKYAGDVLAAICCFGICGTNGNEDSIDPAIAEIREIAKVQRKVIHNCTVVYDNDRSAELYDPDGEPGVVAHITEDGVLTTKWTNGGAMYLDTDSAGATSAERLDAAVAKVRRTYCQPLNAAPDAGAGIENAFDLDLRRATFNSVFVVDQGHVSVPVLVYDGKVCIDYTSGSDLAGVRQINVDGQEYAANTRNLYDVCGVRELFNVADYNTAGQGGAHPNPHYVRRIRSLGEEVPRFSSLKTSLTYIEDFLSRTYDEQVRCLGYNNDANGAATFPRAVNDPLPANYNETRLRAAQNQIRTNMLGGPLPLMIVTEGRLAGTVRVAPLNVAAPLSHTARITHNGAVDTDMLADRMSRTGGRNVIGVAMQKIAPNAQGDIMLHDGV